MSTLPASVDQRGPIESCRHCDGDIVLTDYGYGHLFTKGNRGHAAAPRYRAPRETTAHGRGRRNTEANFWGRLVPNGECLEWSGARVPKGYGVVSWKGRGRAAHRVAWELVNGPIPDGLDIRHSCDNPPCCNPEHLSPGTRRDNVLDSVERGRWSRNRWGEANNSKITAADVARIRELAPSHSQRDLAAIFRISKRTVWNILHGHKWARVVPASSREDRSRPVLPAGRRTADRTTAET